MTPDEGWSAPESTVMASIRAALDADGAAALMTVVGVEGRAYRSPGAELLAVRYGREPDHHRQPSVLDRQRQP